MVVIGGGSGGLTAAAVAASLGAKTLLVEKERLGGDCTWTGCIPSKALLQAAKAMHGARKAAMFGVHASGVTCDFNEVMRRIRRVRAEVYEDADSPGRFSALGVDLAMDAAQFSDPHTVQLGGTRRVSARYVTIATGARAAVPPVVGLDKVRYHTSETLFELTRQPRKLAILGAGPVGIEMAQAFARLGSNVAVLELSPTAMLRGDPELVALLQDVITRDGVDLRFRARTTHIEERDGRIALHFEQTGQIHELSADALLVATGRKPSVQGLNLDAARVRHDSRGIEVDARCRTSVRHIYAVGDVSGRYALTHMSEHMAKVAMANALLKLPLRIDAERVPWAVFTDPELAQVGATERELRAQGRPFETYRFPYSKLDRAVTDGAHPGIIKVFANRRTGRVLGAAILGKAAGDLICSLALAMRRNIKLRQIADTVHPYPTYGLGVRRAADQWYIQRITPRVVRIVQRIFGYRGPIIERQPGTIL